MTTLAMMALGPKRVHEYVAGKLAPSMEDGFAPFEVGVANLSVSADVPVTSSRDAHSIPTVAGQFRKTLAKLTPGSNRKKMGVKPILAGVTATFEPGTMTLVLGQPGSGKSTLLQVLSGRFPTGKNVHVGGEIVYNGIPQSEMLDKLPNLVSYAPQRDKHFPSLTVRETLEFAHACCGGDLDKLATDRLTQGTSAENIAARKVSKVFHGHYPDIVLQQLGLDVCQDTIIGDAMVRGVSGGERKRVTMGEMLFGDKRADFFDEISTGLDSAATFDIVSAQRSITKVFNKTTVMALLQPAPEVLELFDNVLLLHQGHLIYHGPVSGVEDYFARMGYVRPTHRDLADFLLDIGDDSTGLQSSRELANTFTNATAFTEKKTLESGSMTSIKHELLEIGHSSAIKMSPTFHQSFAASTRTVLARQFTLLGRNRAFMRSRAAMTMLMGLLYGSIYYKFDPQDTQVVMGVTFATALFLALGQTSQIAAIMDARAIFYKHRRANFFRTTSYVLATSVCQVPLVIIESLIFGSLVYWLCGFVATVTSFCVYLLLLVITSLAFANWFFFVTCASPNLHVAKPLALLSLLVFILFAGFIVPRGQLPDYLVWVYWINPLAWAVRSLAVAQYRADEFDTCVYGGVDYCTAYGMKMGEYALSTFDVPSDKSWIMLGVAFMACTYVFFLVLGCLVLEHKRFEAPENVTVVQDDLESEHFADTTDGGQFFVIRTKSRVRMKASSAASSTVSQTDQFSLLETPTRKSSSQASNAIALDITNNSHHVVQPVTVAFTDLWYSVPDPMKPKQSIDLLKGVSGYALPKTITALMGSSGAGKTTLMDVIAGRKTGGKIQGQILLNGYPATDLAIRRCTGYCEQMDVHSDAATFREALTFSAFLRQGADVPDSHKLDAVNECLELLDLSPIADKIIRGSSMEQLKRLTIGVELAAQPSVLFLDEPTSGLDARAAKHIMDGVRKVADTGRTVVCTIHQPSFEVFQVFDNLLLLKRGGETVFFGDLKDDAREMISYFESIEGVPKLRDGYNPAAWMLDVIGAGVCGGGDEGNSNTNNDGVAAVTADFVAEFDQSEFKQRLISALNREGVSSPSPLVPAVEFESKRAASNTTQMKLVMQRFFRSYWRTPSYNYTRMLINVMTALLFGLVSLGSDYNTYQGANSGLGMLYLTTMFIGISAYTGALPITCQERESFYRERASQTYNALWYLVAASVVEIPYVLATTLLFTAVFVPMAGFATSVSVFFFYWLNIALLVLLQIYVSQCMCYLLPSIEVASIAGILYSSVCFMFMGFNPPGDSIPSGYKWLYHITPQKYTLAALSAAIFGDCDGNSTDSSALGCQVLADAPPSLPQGITIKGYVENVFLMRYDDMWSNVCIMLIFIAVFRLFSLVALRFVNHQKR